MLHVLMITLSTLLKMGYSNRGEAERSENWLLARIDQTRDDGGEA